MVFEHSLFREGLPLMIGEQKNMAVVGEAQSGREALKFVEKCRPQVVLMDISLPDMSGVEVTCKIKAQ